jgi:hypothetical protein
MVECETTQFSKITSCCSGSPTVHRRGSELEGMGRNENVFQDTELTRERDEQLLIYRLSYRGCRPVAISVTASVTHAAVPHYQSSRKKETFSFYTFEHTR